MEKVYIVSQVVKGVAVSQKWKKTCVAISGLTSGQPSSVPCVLDTMDGFYSMSRRPSCTLFHMHLINDAVYQEDCMRLIARCT